MNFLKKHPWIIAVIVVLLLLVVLVYTSIARRTTALENAVGTVVSPIESAGSSVTTGIGDWFMGLFGRSAIQQENAALQEEVAQLQGQLSLMRELQQENERLREIANYVENHDEFEFLTARVTAKSSSYWFDTFTISAGRSSGVAVDMVVIAPEGLVGRVVEVGANWSKVRTVIDSESSVSALIDRTRDVGVVRGVNNISTLDSSRCYMYYLPYDNDLVPGDEVVTSGLGGVFPKGLLIGEVVEVSRAEDSTERVAVVETAVDFSSLEEVMVILTTIDEAGA